MRSNSEEGMENAETNQDVLFHEEEGEAFLLHVPSGRYFGLNQAGVVVWKALEAGADPVAALQERWPHQERDGLASDTEHLLKMLEAAGLPVPARPPDAH
jgi:hypothetical protein